MSENMHTDTQPIILCDMCMEDKTPARKTCMKCEISMCVQHLQAHLTTPVLLQTHPLTEPMALCGTTKCPQHGKLLEYYCLDDMTCVCVSCAIEDQHRLHNMKTFSTAHKELTEKLTAEQKALQKKTNDEHVSLEKWEKREKEKLGGCSVRLIEAMTNLRDVALNSVQSSVSARMVAIKTSKSSMQAAQREKDTFRFLQMYSQVHQDVESAKAVDLRKGLAPGSERDKLIQEIREQSEKMMEQAAEFWGSLLSMVDPDQELYASGSDLIFKPQIFGACMSLSEDSREVFHSRWLGQCAATLLINSNQSAPNFQKWLIRLSEKYDWIIGICDKKSVQNIKAGPVYGLCCKENQLSYLTTESNDGLDGSINPKGSGLTNSVTIQTEEQHRVSSTPIKCKGKKGDEAESPPETVEVFWNFVASSLSFFKRTGLHQREEIITIKMGLSNWDMAPFVQLGKQDAQISSQPQSQWKCSCGQTRDLNTYSNGMMMSSRQTKCHCGNIISCRCITEMVCELL